MPSAATATFEVRHPENADEIQALAELLGRVFYIPDERLPGLRDAIGEENFRVVRGAGDLAGGLGMVPMGQYFGGRSIPTAGIACVGIDAQYRGTGAGRALMGRTMLELHDRKCPLSTLYPATQTFYRLAGYEQAGALYDTTLHIQSIDVRERHVEVRPIGPDDESAVVELYSRRAAATAGMLDRGPYIWNRVREPRGERANGFLFLEDGRPQGYVFYRLVDTKTAGFTYDLAVTDMAALTPRAGRGVLEHLARHRSMGGEARCTLCPSDPVLNLLPEQSYSIRLNIQWMLRIVNVRAALEQRGYPPSVRHTVQMRIDDPLVAGNEGALQLEVTDGRGIVHEGGDARIALTIEGLAALYSGHRTPAELVATGQLESDDEDLVALTELFAGPAPWMADMF
ncbi:MAG: GNAT family N-acetyltransferase [Planctomycetota bacterium]